MIVHVAIVDDQLPIPPGSDTHGLSGSTLLSLLSLSVDEWHSQTNLKHLLEKIASVSPLTGDELIISAFRHPSILINEIETSSYNPNVVVFDWEYSPHSDDSGELLLTVLKKTNAEVFVYSSFFEAIPPTLDKKAFDSFEKRLNVLAKGDEHTSIFSSEEFIVQHIMTLLNVYSDIQIGKKSIRFTASEYLRKPSEILYLESALGKEFLVKEIDNLGGEISEKSLIKLFDGISEQLYVSKDGQYIIADDSDLMSHKYGPLTAISYLDALKSVGIKGIDRVLSGGIIPKGNS